MTDSFDTAPDPDDRPRQAPVPVVLAEPPGRRVLAPRRGVGWLLRWWLGVSALLLVACVVCVAIGVGQFDFSPLHIVIDGDDFSNGLTIQGVGAGGKILLAIGAVLLALLLQIGRAHV